MIFHKFNILTYDQYEESEMERLNIKKEPEEILAAAYIDLYCVESWHVNVVKEQKVTAVYMTSGQSFVVDMKFKDFTEIMKKALPEKATFQL